jgi:iron complex outermembrane receptor protein
MTREHTGLRTIALGLSVLMAQSLFVPLGASAARKKKGTPPAAASAAPAPTAAPAAPAHPAASSRVVAAAPPPAAVAPAPAAPAAHGAPPAPPAQAAPAPVAAPPPAPEPPVPPLPGDPAPIDPLPPEPPPAMEAYDPNAIDVVKVTVDRREKTLQSYAGSASVYSQEDLQRVNVNSVRELSHVSPSMEIGTQEGNTEIYIRGVGSNNNTELGDPAAATHVDGVYIPRPRGVGSMFFDLERVEVNRGPQGTLRGRNATAGSLNLVTAKPRLGAFGAEGSLQYGNYSQRMTRAMVNIPVGERLALRFASFSENRDPFYKNGGPVHTLQPAESADSLAYRASALWKATDRMRLVVSHDYIQEKGTGYTGTNFAGALRAGILPQEVPDPRRVVYRGPQASQDMKHWGVSGNLNIDLGPVAVEVISSFRDLNYRQNTGGNAGVVFNGMQAPQIDNWSTAFWHTTSRSLVEELRLYSPDSSWFRWTVGGFFFRESQTVFLGTTADQSDGYAGNEFNMPDVKGTSFAGYADGTMDLSSSLRATAGVRVTREEKTRHGIGLINGFYGLPPGTRFRVGTEGFRFKEDRSSYAIAGMNDPAGRVAVYQAGVGSWGARDTLPGLLADPAVMGWSTINEQHGRAADTFADFRAGVDYDLRPNQLVYLNVASGHHSGGFNDTFTPPMGFPGAGVPITATYKPEMVIATEVGSKNELMDRKLRLNGSFFWYEYRDLQLQSIRQLANLTDPTQVAASAYRTNVGTARIQGLEIDGSYRLPFNLVASVSAMFLYARAVDGAVFDDRIEYNPTADTRPVDISGKILPRSPKATVNYGLSQSIPTSFGWFDWIVSFQTRSKYYMTIFNGEGRDTAGNVNANLSDVVPSYTRVDVGVGYTRPDGKTRLDAFCSNLTDAIYMTTQIVTPDLNLRYFNPPRQLGLRLSLYW